MKYIKMLGLLAVAAAALMAFAGTASATVTSPAGTVYNGTLKATSTNSSLDGSVKVACSHSEVEGSVNNGATSGTITKLTFTGCGNDTVEPIANAKGNYGTLAIDSAGTVTSTGARVTVQLHRVVFVPITTHCTYETNKTDVGTLTEGVSPAVLHIGSAPIPQVPNSDELCGNDAVWTGAYTVTTPSSAIVVD